MSATSAVSIVLVHGFWADGSCWNAIIPGLLAQGHEVISVQNPLSALIDDIAATRRAFDKAKHPIVLVGHSWGGVVITGAGSDPRVKSLVYVAALVPDENEPAKKLGEGFAPAPLFEHLEVVSGYIWVKREGIPHFAGDLSDEVQDMIYATQGPANAKLFEDLLPGSPAWKTKPSHYVLAKQDGAINPDQQRAMSAKIGAKVTEIDSSHVAMMSHPDVVIKVIADAAKQANEA